MLEWLGGIALLGLTGNWRGYRMGGKAIGGSNMPTDLKKKFEAARAAGDMDKARGMADRVQKFNDDKKAEKAKTIAVSQPEGDVLTLTDYRKKGANAYLVPVKIENGNIVRGSFQNGQTDDYARAGAGKSNTVTIDLSKSKDGWYEYQEGERASRNIYRGYIKVENGKIVDEVSRDQLKKGGSKQAFLSKVAPVQSQPELSGSQKQVSWAESIREKAIRSGKITESQASSRTDSRWWIDNRSRF
jgi:hypothetical protein